jgi:inhibitor of cysteine peptidase
MPVWTLTISDTGKSIEAHVGDEIEIELPENATTGYRWRVEHAERLSQVEIPQRTDAAQPPPNANPWMGAGGIREFRFRAVEPGIGRLELKYWQEWEGDKSVVQRFAVDVKITD